MMPQRTQIRTSAEVIDLGIGQPDPALLPLELLSTAAERFFSSDERESLQYGAEAGDGYFRLSLGRFLSQAYNIRVSPDELFVTNGASQALDLICSLFTRPGDLVYVEEPTYFLALRILADHHLRVVGLPTDEHGLSIEALEERLAEERPRLIYVIPTFQNPSGVTLPLPRRQRLVNLSQEHQFLVVADEVYHMLAYGLNPPEPLAAYVASETVVSIGSFSKILAPGLRLGWIQAASPILDRLCSCGLLDSGGGLNPFTSGIVRHALDESLQDQHLEQIRTAYYRRSLALCDALVGQGNEEWFTFSEPEGGFFIWLCLEECLDTAVLLAAANAQGVGFQPGRNFSSRGGLRNYMRLCFAYYDIPELERAAGRLCGVLRDWSG